MRRDGGTIRSLANLPDCPPVCPNAPPRRNSARKRRLATTKQAAKRTRTEGRKNQDQARRRQGAHHSKHGGDDLLEPGRAGPVSAAQFVESLFGELPHFFKDEDELRRLWSRPDTRKALLQGLSEKGYGGAQLAEIKRAINAENSDIFDVLAYVAFPSSEVSR